MLRGVQLAWEQYYPIGEPDDVPFGLGVVLYEMFTGKRPFNASTRADLIKMAEEGMPPAPRKDRLLVQRSRPQPHVHKLTFTRSRRSAARPRTKKRS